MPCSMRPLCEQTIDGQQEVGLEAITVILLLTGEETTATNTTMSGGKGLEQPADQLHTNTASMTQGRREETSPQMKLGCSLCTIIKRI